MGGKVRKFFKKGRKPFQLFFQERGRHRAVCSIGKRPLELQGGMMRMLRGQERFDPAIFTLVK